MNNAKMKIHEIVTNNIPQLRQSIFHTTKKTTQNKKPTSKLNKNDKRTYISYYG